MSNFLEIKRKHFRFPAFSDEEGVKIQRESKRKLSYGDDWILTETAKETESYQGYSSFQTGYPESHEERALRRSRKATAEKQGHTVRQQEELKKHRENLPDYNKRIQPEPTATGRTSLFGENQRRSTYKVKNKPQEKAENTVKKEYSGRSYFVPKYIPASIIPDEKKDDISQEALIEAMSKPQASYLLFDTEPAAYQEKKDTDPSVRKFNHSEVQMTRSQYRRSAKEEKKRSILDRSLKGMIEDGANELPKNGYFK
ncbi:hypothetical protein [Enterococcus mediterraneensis]|uniref:hypothetical protein n=1 Tax=Enterococcus mediterraneensis TaxID=2364791 RepID=UPI000F0594A0|nr:hypothetical protein [Enterococcus mediterraneensis]